MAYDTIFIDWDGTLSVSKFWQHWANDPGRIEDHKLIQNKFFKTTPNLLDDWMRGDWDITAIIQEVSRRTGLSVKALSIGLEESCRQMQFISPEIVDIVSKIRENGTRVVIATDNMDTFDCWTAPSLRLDKYFDGILNSHSLRALKKDKYEDGRSKFFTDYFSVHSIEPSHTVLIDDSPKNALVQEFGISYVQVTKDESAMQALRYLV